MRTRRGIEPTIYNCARTCFQTRDTFLLAMTTQVPFWVYFGLGLILLLMLLRFVPMFGGALLVIIVLGAWALAAQKGVLNP